MKNMIPSEAKIIHDGETDKQIKCHSVFQEAAVIQDFGIFHTSRVNIFFCDFI